MDSVECFCRFFGTTREGEAPTVDVVPTGYYNPDFRHVPIEFKHSSAKGLQKEVHGQGGFGWAAMLAMAEEALSSDQGRWDLDKYLDLLYDIALHANACYGRGSGIVFADKLNERLVALKRPIRVVVGTLCPRHRAGLFDLYRTLIGESRILPVVFVRQALQPTEQVTWPVLVGSYNNDSFGLSHPLLLNKVWMSDWELQRRIDNPRVECVSVVDDYSLFGVITPNYGDYAINIQPAERS